MSDIKDVGYAIGDTVWNSGDQVRIKCEPYLKYGGVWQDATKENGDTVCLLTPEQKERDSLQKRKEWNSQQVQFRNLREEHPALNPFG